MLNHITHGKTAPNSPSDCAWLDPSFIGNLAHRMWHTTQDIMRDIALVVVLFASRGPLTITRVVPIVVVNALNGVALGWPLAHIFKKAFKRLPSFAQLNSSASIVWQRGVTAGFHACPYAVGVAPAEAMRRKLSGARCGSLLAKPATARHNAPSQQRASSNNCSSAAITHALPFQFFGVVTDWLNCEQFMESLSGQIFKSWHRAFPCKRSIV